MIGNSWDFYLKEEFNKNYFKGIINEVNKRYKNTICYPPKNEIFNAFRLTPYEKVKVVIIGQDPYHGEHQAEGLSFSVKNNINRPPSLQNIFKELETDLGLNISNNNSLIPWAKEGVLLLNSVLTVEKDKPASHKDIGWEKFTDEVIKILNKKEKPIVFILWGNFAKAKKKYITNNIHKVIESAHPSPFSAHNGFFDSRPFSKTNEYLKSKQIEPINWQI